MVGRTTFLPVPTSGRARRRHSLLPEEEGPLSRTALFSKQQRENRLEERNGFLLPTLHASPSGDTLQLAVGLAISQGEALSACCWGRPRRPSEGSHPPLSKSWLCFVILSRVQYCSKLCFMVNYVYLKLWRILT